jgi:nucleotide-binding universal stress UspA family protein
MVRTGVELRRLTFGDDCSPGSDDAWEWVVAQSWPDWRVDVLQAGMGDADTAASAVPRVAPRRCGFVSVRTVTSRLEARVALPAHVGSDLIIVGARGTGGGVVRTRLGGTAEWLANHVEVPVIVARRGGPVRTVLACVDGSASDEAVVASLLSMPWADRAMVTVLSVLGADESRLEAAQRVAHALADTGVRAQPRVTAPDPTTIASNPRFKVFEVIDGMRPDLVVVGRHGDSRLMRALKGSTATDVAGYADCSVLLAGCRA